MSANPLKLYAVVPAAGVGARMQTKVAKQYLHLNGLTVLEHTLNGLLEISRIEKIVVAIAQHDQNWNTLSVGQNNRVTSVVGGETRAQSVLNGLEMIAQFAKPDDWVLVHDAARPCLSAAALTKLIDALYSGREGGILALKAKDTVKIAKGSDNQHAEVSSTLDRDLVWHAQTPQMFRLDELRDAISTALKAGEEITDEASAMERANHVVRLIEGEGSNLKITTPEDLVLAQSLLEKALQ